MQYIVRYWRVAADLPTSPERRWLGRWAVAFAVLVAIAVGSYLAQAQKTIADSPCYQSHIRQTRGTTTTDANAATINTPNTRAVAGPG